MKTGNRDLLVLTKHDDLDAEALEYELELLGRILYTTESIHNFCIANEVIDINRYKIIQLPHLIERAIRTRIDKPFVFISNKN